MVLTPEERDARKRERLLEKAQELQGSTYSRKFVAPIFQRMIRAEYAADPRQYVTCIVMGKIDQVKRDIGECACVTCGRVMRWNSGIRGCHTGHFLGSRRNSILYTETNVAPQCSHCNFYRSGSPQEFRQWMLYVRGEGVVSNLERLATTSVSFTRFDLVDMRIVFTKRLRAAEKRMKEQ